MQAGPQGVLKPSCLTVAVHCLPKYFPQGLASPTLPAQLASHAFILSSVGLQKFPELFQKRRSDKREALGVFPLARLELGVESVGLGDDIESEFLVLPRVIIAKFVLRLAVGFLVVAEPYPDLVQLPGELPAIIRGFCQG